MCRPNPKPLHPKINITKQGLEKKETECSHEKTDWTSSMVAAGRWLYEGGGVSGIKSHPGT